MQFNQKIINHSNHINDNVFIHFLSEVNGQAPLSEPHACLKSYTPWLVHRQMDLVYVQYMLTYILQYVNWKADQCTVQKIIKQS